MITLQILANLFAITNIYLVTHDQVKLGCAIGLPGQFLWMYLFYANAIPWLILTDFLIAGIYVKRLWQMRREPMIKSRFRGVSL